MHAYMSNAAIPEPFRSSLREGPGSEVRPELAEREARAILAETEPKGTEHVNVKLLTVRGSILAEALEAFVNS